MKPTGPARLVSKFVATYDKLFQGLTSGEISPHETPSQFWSNLLSLNVDRTYFSQKFRNLTKDELLAYFKPLVNVLVTTTLHHLRHAQYGDAKKRNACETLSVVVRCVLEKNLLGWEVMEVIGGGVAESDTVFLDFVNVVADILSDKEAPADLKHQVLQLAVVFVCGINQLSPGAFLLRRDLFPTIVSIIKSPDTQAFTFEASLLLSIVANFHRTDAAKLNPYLRSMKETEDREMLKSLSYSVNFTMDTVIKAYQEISDDSPTTFTTTMSNLLSSFRPDRALSPKPVDSPRDLFKNQPVEAAVILLPTHDFLHLNPVFCAVLLEPLINDSQASGTPNLPPLLFTLLTLSSYILTHASSVQSARATAYASLCLVTLLHLAENDVAMSAMIQPRAQPQGIRLCRQREPTLPLSSASSPPLCALLDCCVLWLRHNLHKRLEVQSYLTCIWILHRTLWFLSKTRRRLDYHWEELWRSLLVMLDFVSTKLVNSARLEQLSQEAVVLLEFSLQHADCYLGSAQAVHQFVYELVRSSAVVHKQQPLCARPMRRGSINDRRKTSPTEALRRILATISHYEKKVQESGVTLSSASSVLKLIAKEVEREGLFGAKEMNEDDSPNHSDNLGEIGFVRYAYADGLALMPGPDT